MNTSDTNKQLSTLNDLIDYIDAEAKRNGWYAECELEHGPSHTRDNLVLTEEMQHQFILSLDRGEGIYLDWEYVDYNEYPPMRHKVSCLKTLETSAEAMEAMGRLAGRLTFLANTAM